MLFMSVASIDLSFVPEFRAFVDITIYSLSFFVFFILNICILCDGFALRAQLEKFLFRPFPVPVYLYLTLTSMAIA